MIGIGEIQLPPAPSFWEQGVDDLRPHPAALIFEQASVTGVRRCRDVLGQVFPLAARFEDVQDTLEDLPFGCPRPSRSCTLGQQTVQLRPVGVRHVRALRLAGGVRNLV
jgi:hypothetical protein